MTLRFFSSLIFIFFCTPFLNSSLLAQEINSPVTDKQGWVNLGVGPGKVIDLFEGSAVGTFTYASNRKLVTARYIYSQASFSDLVGIKPYQEENVSEFSLLYGTMTKRRFAFASIAVGLGLVRFDLLQLESDS